MQYKKLGDSGLAVSRLCLGTMPFGNPEGQGESLETAAEVIRGFIRAGGTFIDTADVYAGGRSEETVGRIVKEFARDTLVLATKAGFPIGSDPNARGLSRKHLLASVESSLRRLQTDYIDLFYLHMWDPLVPISETVRAMDDLVRQGKVRYFGFSNFSGWQAMKIHMAAKESNIPFIAAQYQYSLIVRDIEYELPGLCETEGIGLVPWAPLGGGFLSGAYSSSTRQQHDGQSGDVVQEKWFRRASERNWRILQIAEQLAGRNGTDVLQISLAWLLARPSVDSVIISARSREQLEANLAAVDVHLAESELQQLNDAGKPVDLYPYRMIEQHSGKGL